MSLRNCSAHKRVMPTKAKRNVGQKKRKGKAKRNVSNMLGRRTTAPVASATATRSNIPRFSQRQGTKTINHAELLGTISGHTGFSVTIYPLNPGLAETFPWLSKQAQGWEMYRFKKLKFIYVSRCATTKIGSIMMIPEYDPNDSVPLTEEIASSFQGCIEDSSWKNLECRLNVAGMHGPAIRKYVRDSAVPGNLGTYDAGKFYLARVSQDNTDAVGKLWVEYEVEFFIPQTMPAEVKGRNSAFFAISTGSQSIAAAVEEFIDWEQINNPLNLTYNGTTGNFVPAKGAWLFFGQIILSDTNAELLDAVVKLTYNGAATVPPQRVYVEHTMVAGGDMVVPFHFYVVCEGGVAVQTTITGVFAAGTVTLVQYQCHMIVMIA